MNKPWLKRTTTWVLLCLALVAYPLGRVVAAVLEEPEVPAPLVELPAWRLVGDAGVPFGAAELRGKAYVANFFFTSCGSVCPRLSKRMAEVEERTKSLGDRLRLVSVTVDPENDTPDRLREYAARYRKDPARWTFVTGPFEELERVVTQGFKIAMGRGAGAEGQAPEIFHGEKMLLVDGEGRVRRYYDADDAGIDALVRDASALVGD